MDATRKKWVVLAALCWVFMINMGMPMYGAGVLSTAMTADLGLDRKAIGAGFGLMTLVMGLAAPLAAWLVHRVGTKLVIAIGSLVLVGTACWMATHVHDAGGYTLVFGIGVGIALCLTTSVPGQACLATWFTRRRALSIALMWIAAGLGGFIAPPVLAYVISTQGWKDAWFLIGGLAAVSAVMAFALVRSRHVSDPPDDFEAAPMPARHASGGVYRSQLAWSPKDAFCTRSMWVIVFAVTVYSAGVSVFLAHGAVHLMGAGKSREAVAAVLSAFALGAIGGKLVTGFLADRHEPRFLFSLALLLIGSGMGVLAFVTALPVALLCGAAIGLGNGGVLVCWPAMTANFFGAKNFARILGLQMPVTTIVSAGVTYLAGASADLSGGYAAAFAVIAAVLVIGSFMLYGFARPPRIVEPLPVH